MAELDLTTHRDELIEAVNNIRSVILKLSLNPRASYSIDTMQGKETVTAASLPMLRNMMKALMGDIQDINDTLNGTGDPVFTRPSW